MAAGGAGLALLALLSLTACNKPEPAPAPTPDIAAAAPAPPAADAAPPSPGDPPPALAGEDLEAAKAHLAAMKQRQACNRVMGCDPATALMQYGRAAVPLIAGEVETSGGTEAYWVPKLVELLGQMGDDRALPVLHALLEDTRWEPRARAAQALGRLARRESLESLQTALAQARESGDAAFHGTTLFALARVAAPNQRAALAEGALKLLPATPDGLGRINPSFLPILMEIVAQWPLPQALPAVRLTARHLSPFARRAGLRTLGALRDEEGIPIAIGRLDDKLPSVRREALLALQRITGDRGRAAPEAWKAWCETRGCRAHLEARPSAPDAPSGAELGGPGQR